MVSSILNLATFSCFSCGQGLKEGKACLLFQKQDQHLKDIIQSEHEVGSIAIN